MKPRLLLDTHVVVRWLYEPKKLSADQRRSLNEAVNHGECVGVSAFSLIEIVLLNERQRIKVRLDRLFQELNENPAFQILPLTTAIACEMAEIGDALRDPADRMIVATARVHRLRLLTADQRIIASNLVAVVE
ncbi:MAG: PilT protein domain protein [Candidatus Solibacter sp.]|nr:PilT protein domain protein [Candidatus Solibacter sp.]